MNNFQVISDIIFKYKENFSDEDYIVLNKNLKIIHNKFNEINNCENSDTTSSSDDTTSHSDTNNNTVESSESSDEQFEPIGIIQTAQQYLRPILTNNFRIFAENNYQDIGVPQYNNDGQMLISGRNALKILLNYIKNNGLADRQTGIVQMDETLLDLFPSYSREVEVNGNIVREGNFYIRILPSAISVHKHLGRSS
jgi:hypothetical protein